MRKTQKMDKLLKKWQISYFWSKFAFSGENRNFRKLGWLEEVTAITLSCCLVSSEATEELLEVGQDWKVEKY